jgi:hypothetical protein
MLGIKRQRRYILYAWRSRAINMPGQLSQGHIVLIGQWPAAPSSCDVNARSWTAQYMGTNVAMDHG